MSAPNGNDKSLKRRAACDECRTKKLKCTGEQPACARCVREKISCVYSPQKQMGRPKKRAREEDPVDLTGWYDSHKSESSKQSHTQITTAGGEDWQAGVDAALSNGNRWEGFPTLSTGSTDDLALLQPWISQTGQQWNWNQDAAPTNYGDSVPGLTPDSSTGSPQVRQNQQPQGDQQPLRDASTQMLLEPTYSTCSTIGGPTCACLSSLYLTLNTLQGMDSTFTFPFALHPLREAMQVGAEVLTCEVCPTRFITGVQNTQILGTLLLSIAERFGKVLENITTETRRAKQAGETKKFRLADLNTSSSHLHHGGLGCRAAFNIDLEPEEWRMMAKKVVKAEVFGPSPSSTSSAPQQQIHTQPHLNATTAPHDTNPAASSSTSQQDSPIFQPHDLALEPPHCPGGSGGEHTDCAYFLGLTQKMFDRQMKWHRGPPPEDAPKTKTGEAMGGASIPTEQHLCLKMPSFARQMVAGFDWS